MLRIRTMLLCGLLVALAAPVVMVAAEYAQYREEVATDLAAKDRPLAEGWLIEDDEGGLWFCSLNESAWWRYDPVRKAWRDAHVFRPNGIATRVRCYTTGRVAHSSG